MEITLITLYSNHNYLIMITLLLFVEKKLIGF